MGFRSYIVFFLVGSVACRNVAVTGESLHVRCEIAPLPPRVGAVAITVRLEDGPSSVKGAEVVIEGNMSHPGMGPTVSKTQEVAAGVYAGTLDFSMPGDWVVLMHIVLPGGLKVERQMNVSGVLEK
jgi:hypothetical protein